MELLIHSVKLDWPVLLPILICSILTIGVALNRFSFYNENKRDVIQFIRLLQVALSKNDLSDAQRISMQTGGVIGEVAEEGIRILEEQNNDFSRSFDISISLATRKLEKYLTILGTIGGVAPFLGLFGTVVRILLTFKDMAAAGHAAQAADVMYGIGSALIATAFGLGVAIVAVIFFNLFQSVVKHFENDFNLIKLLFLNYVDAEGQSQSKYSSSPKVNL